jgi:Ser/Thr protein kinase RdoA (MazF antagonist)
VTDDYQTYLERYHAAHQTPESVLRRMVKRATGSALQAKTRLTDASNEVYLVTTASGEEYLLKIAVYPGTDLRQEQWAMDQCRAAGAPVPEVVLVDVEEHDGEALEFMVQMKVPGRPLAAILPGLGEAERARIWRELGTVLGRIHSVAVGGFWKRQPDGTWDFPDWVSVMNSAIRDRGDERPWLLKAGFSERECDQMMRLMVRYRDDFDCPQPVLCHCDYLPEHILVSDDLRVAAVVDFGDCCGDHPIRDSAIVAAEETMDLAGILSGYPGEWVRAGSFLDRLHLHRLTLEMGYLAHHLQHRPDHPAVEFHIRGLRRTLGWLLKQCRPREPGGQRRGAPRNGW